MAIAFEKQSYPGHFPEIWRGECKMLPGGFSPAQDIPVGTVLRRGTPVFVDFEKRTAAVCKTTVALGNSTTTAVRVEKGLYFNVGDQIAKYGGTATAAVSIKSIDRSNPLFDVIETSAAITGLVYGDIIMEAAQKEGKLAPAYTPNMVVGADRLFDGKGLPTIDAAYEAVVLYPSLAFPALPEWLQGVALRDNPNIIFITQ